MYYSPCVMRLYLILTFILPLVTNGMDAANNLDNCRTLELNPHVAGRKLVGHVFRREEVKSSGVCEVRCFIEADCVSFNVGPPQDGKHWCELSDSDHTVHPEDLIYEVDGTIYTSFINLCSSNPCSVNSRCQTGFTDKGYRCVCYVGFTGQDCSKDVDECSSGIHNCDINAICDNTHGSFNCSCKQGYHEDGVNCFDIDECSNGDNDCDANSLCTNTEGSFTCTCSEEYQGNGTYCYRVPTVHVQLHAVTSEEGDDVIIMCNATGVPLPKITWTKSGGSLPVRRSIVSEGNLTIMNVTMEDSGSYVCTATSIVGTNSSSVQFQVYSALKFITRPPSFVLVYTGQALNLSCVASSSLEPTVVWKLDGAASLPEGAVADASYNLIIGSVNITHAGDYICSAVNSFSSIHTSVTVQVKIPETCSRVKANISGVSGDYVIDPDGERGEAPLTLYCNMTDKGGVGVTAVSHDSESRTHVKGFDPVGSYARDISYIGSSISQIKGLITASKNCQQFIKYECKASAFYSYYYNHFNAWWVSSDGKKLTYWGGDTQGCACGMNNSCDNPHTLCNCDANDYVWREDSGLLTNKTHLPVSQLRFGDTGDKGEEGFYTLGKLKCYGMN